MKAVGTLLISMVVWALARRQTLEEVSKKQLDDMLETEDYLAVVWHAKNCKTCDRVMNLMETKSPDLEEFGFRIARCSDRKAAKVFGVLTFPSLTFFKAGKGINFDGDLSDEFAIMDFLVSPESLNIPDLIEEVNAKQLENLIRDKTFIAVLFYNGQEESMEALKHLETIDDNADKLGIGFVKINDLDLVDEYGLSKIPSLVYYRNRAPILFEGDFTQEDVILDWLIHNRSTGEEDDVIEEVSADALEAMMSSVEHLAVLFYDAESRKSDILLDALEKIDDDLDAEGIHFVKIRDDKRTREVAESFGVVQLPSLVYYRNELPSVFQGTLSDESEVLDWLLGQSKSSSVEEVTGSMLRTIVSETRNLAVLFYDRYDEKSMALIEVLETIDDDLDRVDVGLVKIGDGKVAADEYGIDDEIPAIVYFENGIPSLYTESQNSADDILAWLREQVHGDEIENVNAEMLEKLIAGDQSAGANGAIFGSHNDVAVLVSDVERINNSGVRIKREQFRKCSQALWKTLLFLANPDSLLTLTLKSQDSRDNTESAAVLNALEDIDDDCDRHGIPLVKIDDSNFARTNGIDQLPALLYYENGIPNIYKGNLVNEDEVLGWLIHQMTHDSIEEVTDEMLTSLVSKNHHVAVVIYDSDDKMSSKVLNGLENVDDDLARHDIMIVKMDKEKNDISVFDIKEYPSIILFDEGVPEVFEGDETKEGSVMEWLVKAALDESYQNGMKDEVEEDERKPKKTIEVPNKIIADFEEGKEDSKTVSKPTKKKIDAINDDKLDKPTVHKNIPTSKRIPTNEKILGNEAPKTKRTSKETISGDVPQVQSKKSKPGTAKKISEQQTQSQTKQDPTKATATKMKAESSKSHKKHLAQESGSALNRNIRRLAKNRKGQEEQEPGEMHAKARTNIFDEVKLDDPEFAAQKKTREESPAKRKPSQESPVRPKAGQSVFAQPKPTQQGGKRKDIPSKKVPRQELPQEAKHDQDVPNQIKPTKSGKEKAQQKIPSKVKDQGTIYQSISGKTIASEMQRIQLSSGGQKQGNVILEVRQEVKIIPEKSKSKAEEKVIRGETKQKIKENLPDDSKNKTAHEGKRNAKREDLKKKTVKDELERTEKVSKTKTPSEIKPDQKNQGILEKPTEPLGDSRVKRQDADVVKDQENEEKQKSLDEEEKNVMDVISNSPNVVVFFYEQLDKVASKIAAAVESVEFQMSETFPNAKIKFLHVDVNDVDKEISVTSSPAIVFFKNGEAVPYEANLLNEETIFNWVMEEYRTNEDVIEDLSTEQIRVMAQHEEYLLVFAYTHNCGECSQALQELEQVDDDMDAVGVSFVKTDDESFMGLFGVKQFPSIVYFENGKPSFYDGDPTEAGELLTWLLYQMKEDTIENINRELLLRMIEENEFLAVFFYSDNPDSSKMLRHLELIDDEALEYGVRMVKISDPLMAKKYGHRMPPGLGYFRQGNYIKYEGDNFDEEEIFEWITDPNVMEIGDKIEKINRKMFEKLKARNENMAVLFYTENDCKQCEHVLHELENIDDEAELAGVPIVKLEDRQLAKSVGVFAHPSLVIFKNFGEDATIFAGDLKNEESILEWLLIQKDPSNEAIESQEGETLRRTIRRTDSVAVFIYSQTGCENCLSILQSLENIDDDTARQDIKMVKTTDAEFAKDYGIEEFPSLVFFSEEVPNVYEGDLTAEEEVLDWLIEMKVESHIELITRPMLETMVDDVEYLAVFFFKQNCRTCDQVLAELENIDDECDLYGIQMVKLQDPQLAKRYGLKTFPSLVYFRNGNPLTYDGDLRNEDSVLEWLLDDDNRELSDEIEEVNFRMLERLLETSTFMAVFFYDEDCIECDSILESLEIIDDDADAFGIDFIKNSEPKTARSFNIFSTPALEPIIYDGDLHNEAKVLTWLTSLDVFDLKDQIVEVNRKLLEKLLEENDFVAVYFFDESCPTCPEVLKSLESIDHETDLLDIVFVKVNDQRYAKKYGVNRLPALVYFRRKFPSIYRDDLRNGTEVLDWLRRNRFKHMELNLFVYSMALVVVAFVCYTAFLIFGLSPKDKEKRFDDEDEEK